MKRIVAFVSLLLLLTEGTALAKPDYSELNQAFTNYFASLDAIMKVVPSVTNASGTVQLINAWSLANEELCVVGERFAAKYPEVYDEPEPPPEFVATFEKMDRLKTDYAALNAGLGRLARQFRAVPEVQEAMKRFMKAIDRFDRLSSPPKK